MAQRRKSSLSSPHYLPLFWFALGISGNSNDKIYISTLLKQYTKLIGFWNYLARVDRVIFTLCFSVLFLQSWPPFGRIFPRHCKMTGSWGQDEQPAAQRISSWASHRRRKKLFTTTANTTQCLTDSDWVTHPSLNQSLWARIWDTQTPLSQLGSILEVCILTKSGERVDFLKWSKVRLYGGRKNRCCWQHRRFPL